MTEQVETTVTTATTESDSLLATATTEPQAFGDWRDEVPAKFLKDGEVDHANLVKSYKHLESKMRAGEAPPSEAAAYDFKVPDGVELTDDLKGMIEGHKARALELGLSQKQFEEYTTDLQSLAESIRDEYLPSKDKAEAALKEAWGAEYNQQLALARKAFSRYGSEADLQEIGNNPVALRLLAKIGAELGEDKNPAHGAAVNESLAQLRADPDYTNPHSPRYRILQDKVLQLTRERLGQN